VFNLEFFPDLRFGLLNGWIFFLFYIIVFVIAMSTCPKEVKARLFDRKGWGRSTIIITAIGKLFGLINIVTILLSSLKIGTIEFVIGAILYSIGLTGIVVAIINYRDAPLDKPITNGLYKISRNPQLVTVWFIFTGIILVIGSWLNLIFLGISILCSHFSILGEEKCLTEQYGESYLEYKKRVPRYFIFF